MSHRFRHVRTFQKKLIICNLFIIVCLACAISVYSYYSYKSDAVEAATKSCQNQIEKASDNMEMGYREMLNIILNFSERRSLFLAASRSGEDSASNKFNAIFASDILRDLCAVSGYSKYIDKLIIYRKDQVYLQAGNSNGAPDDLDRIMQSAWFPELLNRSTGEYQLPIVSSPFAPYTRTTESLLPLIRPLAFSRGQIKEDAWIFLAISPKLYGSLLDDLDPAYISYVVTKDGDIIAERNTGRLNGSALLPGLLKDDIETSGSFQTRLGQEPCIVSYKKQPESGVLTFAIMPVSDIIMNPDILRNTVLLVFFFCMTIGLFLSLLSSRYLVAPIRRLADRLESVGEGNFTPDATLETPDELGIIGKKINEMSSQISRLMASRIESEREKKDLEIRMLQAQINPHFLYNTLDSVCWIATMQECNGIVKIVSSLSSLLRNMVKGVNEKVTIQQELEFMEHYIAIEKIRYMELFQVEVSVSEPRLYHAKILKLTLQPLVENAIFNGIEPSGHDGLIRIRVYSEDNGLFISVEDDGIGIPAKKIKTLLDGFSSAGKGSLSGIGLPNVNHRIKLVYGDCYGLKIESEEGRYTRILISLPLEFQEETLCTELF